MSRGRVFVISSPSGGGKTTVIEALREKNRDLCYSVSATTRDPRPGEVNGRDYYFLKEDEFLRKIEENAFIEWARVHNFYYGTPRDQIEKYLGEGKKVILDIDVQGGLKIKEQIPDSVLIFLLPPSMDELRKRLIQRGTEEEEILRVRIENAKKEIDMADRYDYQVINDILDETVRELDSIINRNNIKK